MGSQLNLMAEPQTITLGMAVDNLRALLQGNEGIEGEGDRLALRMAITALVKLAGVHHRVVVAGEDFTKEDLAELVEIIEATGGGDE